MVTVSSLTIIIYERPIIMAISSSCEVTDDHRKTRQIDYTRMREMARENYANVINKCKHRCIEDFFNHTLYTYSVSLYNKSLNVTLINCVD